MSIDGEAPSTDDAPAVDAFTPAMNAGVVAVILTVLLLVAARVSWILEPGAAVAVAGLAGGLTAFVRYVAIRGRSGSTLAWAACTALFASFVGIVVGGFMWFAVALALALFG